MPEKVSFANTFMELIQPFKPFWQSATLLCDFLQYPQNMPVAQYRQELILLLLETYKLGLFLPDAIIEADDNLIDDRFDDKVNGIELAYLQEVGDVNHYFDAYDPFDFEDNILSEGSILDELKEIFRQLKIQLLKLETGEQKWIADATWSVQFYLNLSLQNELIDVSRALHHSLKID